MEHSKDYNSVLVQYAEYMNTARPIMKPSCHVCKVCNGRACAGRFTNSLEMGSKGNNQGFIVACEGLSRIKIELDVIHEDYEPDTSFSLFGRLFELPVFASPIAKILTDYSYDSPFFNNNNAYARALLEGCHDAGGMAWLGDNKAPGYFPGQIEAIPDVDGIGIPTIKPWADRDEYWKRVQWCKQAGAFAIATDLDAIGLGYQYSADSGGKNEGVCARSLDELKEMRKRIEGPFIIKGIMSVRAAVKARESGADAILISNHGGNVVEGSLAPCDVVADIRRALGPDYLIFADGGVRSGEDVFKMIALGADAVGIGRPYVVAVYGGGRHGAYIYTEKIYWELKNIMRLANCRTLSDITMDKLYKD